MEGNYKYAACGLAISSEMPIPGLTALAHAVPPDLHVEVVDHSCARGTLGKERIRYISREAHEDGSPQLTVWTASSGSHRLLYRDGTEFVIDRHATRVTVRWEAPLTYADAAVYLLGPVLGFVMRLRGIVPLHASAVLIGTGATVFVGDAGAGKSTTAGAFAALGYGVLSDDLLPLMDDDGRILARPSHPRLTIWPDSATALFGSSDELPALTPTYDKRYIDLQSGHRFHDAPVPLEVIYVLGSRTTDRERVRVRTLPPQAALMALVRNTYGNYLLDASMRAVEFDVLSRIADRIPVRLVAFSNDIEHLFESCQRLADTEPTEAEAEAEFQ